MLVFALNSSSHINFTAEVECVIPLSHLAFSPCLHQIPSVLSPCIYNFHCKLQSTSALMLECVCIRKTPHANEGDLRLS